MMEATHILIVDDEAPARNRLRDLLNDCQETFPLVIAGAAENGRQAIDIINTKRVDIVLADIRMPVMDGIELARHIAIRESEASPPVRIIFTTAYDQYAVQAFELNAVDYLLKPIRHQRLLAALQKAQSLQPRQAESVAKTLQSTRSHLSINERGRLTLVPLSEVLYLHAEQKYVTAKTCAREFLLEEPLSKLEEEFSGVFVRIHRSTLIAKSAIDGFEKKAL